MKYKYLGTEKFFRDPNSPFNDIPTVELERMVRQAELKDRATKALNELSPEVRRALEQLVAPKETIIDPEFDNPQPEPEKVHRYRDGTPIYGGDDNV